MSARIPPGFAEFWVRYELNADPEPMYWSIGLDVDLAAASGQSICDGVDTFVAGTMDNICSTEYLVGAGHLIVGNDGGDIRYDSTNTALAGDTTTSCPQNCAILVRKNTGAGGRRGRGRAYLPGVPEVEVTARGDLTTTFKASVQTQLDAMFAGVNAIAGVDGIVLLHGSLPFTPTPITDFVCQSKIATQRRRLRP